MNYETYLAVWELVDLDLALDDLVHDLLLEVRHLLGGHRVRLGDHRDDVDLVVQALHELHVERLQPVAGWRDEVEAGVNLDSE